MRAAVKRVAIAAAMVLAMPMAGRADDDRDHDLARELYEHGEIRPLSEILRMVGKQAPGDIVAVDLVRRGERWIYHFQIISADGRRTAVDVDAGAARLLHEAEDRP